jgi:hypothetical protein
MQILISTSHNFTTNHKNNTSSTSLFAKTEDLKKEGFSTKIIVPSSKIVNNRPLNFS